MLVSVELKYLNFILVIGLVQSYSHGKLLPSFRPNGKVTMKKIYFNVISRSISAEKIIISE